VLAQGLFLARDPVDLGTSSGAEELRAAVADLLADDQCDALVVVFVPAITSDPTDHAQALADAVRGAEKPVVSTFLASEGVPEVLTVSDGEAGGPQRGSIPSYPSPERAVLALARAVRYTQWRSRPVGDFVVPSGVDLEAAQTLVAAIEPGPRTLLTDEQADALLRCVGVIVAPFRRVRSADDAVAVARELGGAVVLKTADRSWRHRTDLRGVHVGLTESTAIASAYEQLVELSGSDEVYVQVQAPPGIPCVVEVRDDPSFGSLVSFGLAGVVGELLGDRAYRATPLSTMDAATLVRAPRAAPLLDGYRGARRADLPALEAHLARVAAAGRPFPMRLCGTGTFRPLSPVVFVQVVEGAEACARLQQQVRNASGPVARELQFPYHPHVTVAHGIDEAALDRAYEELAGYTAQWPCTGFGLHEQGSDGVWRKLRDFPFGSTVVPPQASAPEGSSLPAR
jgi:hypothetical protein